MDTDMVLSPQLLSGLVIGVSIGTVAGYIGSLMITKRMTLMAGALGHLTLPGVALGLLYGFDISLGALLFLVLGVVGIWGLEKITKLPFEAITAVVFTSSLAIAFLFLPHEETYAALLGDISRLRLVNALICFCLSAIIFVVVSRIYKKMVLLGISADLAQVEGINGSTYNLIYLISIALVIALGVRIIGGLMTAALVAIPAATSKNLSSSLRQYAVISSVLGGVSCVGGVAVAYATKLPVGPIIILTSTLFFIVSLVVRKK